MNFLLLSMIASTIIWIVLCIYFFKKDTDSGGLCVFFGAFALGVFGWGIAGGSATIKTETIEGNIKYKDVETGKRLIIYNSEIETDFVSIEDLNNFKNHGKVIIEKEYNMYNICISNIFVILPPKEMMKDSIKEIKKDSL